MLESYGFGFYFALYLMLSLGLTAGITLLSNYTIRRRKNFQQVTQEMIRLNAKIDDFNAMFSLTQEQKNYLYFTQRYLEECSMQLGRTQLWNRALMFGVTFIANKIIVSKFKFTLQMRLPFALPFPLKYILQRGYADEMLVLKMPGIAFLVNYSVRRLLSATLAVKLPKSRMPLNRFAKYLGGENAGEIEKMMGWMGM